MSATVSQGALLSLAYFSDLWCAPKRDVAIVEAAQVPISKRLYVVIITCPDTYMIVIAGFAGCRIISAVNVLLCGIVLLVWCVIVT